MAAFRKDVPDGHELSFDAAIASDVPLGGGLSSSAALEVSMATLLEELTGVPVGGVEKALRQAEQSMGPDLLTRPLYVFRSVDTRGVGAFFCEEESVAHKEIPSRRTCLLFRCDRIGHYRQAQE